MSTPEVEAYVQKLRELRAEVLKLCDGLPAEALNWKPPAPDTNSIFAITTHIVGSETAWIHQVVGGIDVKRNRSAEFTASGTDLTALKGRMDAVAQRSEVILYGLPDAEWRRSRDTMYGPRDARWCVLHSIHHTACHIGHIQLTRQLWENQ
jgi:uncharacterized damage-inducible protein DinB